MIITNKLVISYNQIKSDTFIILFSLPIRPLIRREFYETILGISSRATQFWPYLGGHDTQILKPHMKLRVVE